MSGKKITRRDFVADAGKIGLGVMIVPRHVLGGVGYQAPSDTINFAVIGFGGMGSENALELAKTENLVAFADVDFGYSEKQVAEKLKDDQKKDRPEGITLKQKFDKAARYSDFREMLDKQKDIDGVVDRDARSRARRRRKGGDAAPASTSTCRSRSRTRCTKRACCARWRSRTRRSSRRWAIRGTRARARASSTSGSRPGDRAGARGAHLDGSAGGLLAAGRSAARPAIAPPPAARSARSEIRTASGTSTQLLASAMGSYPVPAGIALGSLSRPDRGKRSLSSDLSSVQLARVGRLRRRRTRRHGRALIDQPFWALGLTYPTSIEATSTPWGTMPIPPDPSAPAGSREARGYNRPVSYPVAYDRALSVRRARQRSRR